VDSELIALLLLSLALARITSFILSKIYIPPIASYMLTGIIIGPSLVNLINVGNYPKGLVTLALLFLLFYAGLNVDFRGFRHYFKESILLTLGGVLLTSTLIMVTLRYLGFPLYASIIAAISLSNTATEVVVIMLEQAGSIDDTFKRVVISASFFDDILAVILMSVIKGGIIGGFEALIDILKFIVSFVLVLITFILIIKFFQGLIHAIIVNWGYLVTLSSIIFFALPFIFNELGLGTTLGAYLAGLLISSLRLVHDPTLIYTVRVEELISRVGTILEFFIIPIFFLYVGIRVNLNYVFTSLTLILLLLAIIGKFVGSLITMSYKEGLRRGTLMGIAMNVRGSLEPAVALLALESGVINQELFNAIIMVSLLTSLIIPILFVSLRRTLTSIV